MKLESISPALNGRFTAHMKNGEEIIISRQYVPEIKCAVLGGK
jgi:DNA-binding LytR/AlgR family response regulator